MIVRHMRYFAAVAEHGGIGRAATALRVAQPALSRQIHSLEREVGTPLLQREHRGVSLTPAGAALLDGVKFLREQLDRTLRRTRLAHEGRLGTLRLGLGRVAVENSAISRAIAEVRERFPEVELVVDEVPSLLQSDALRSRSLNLAIGIEGRYIDASLRRMVLFPDAVERALLPANHALASSSTISPSQLRSDRLLMLRTSLGPFPELYEALRQLGLSQWEEHESPDTVYGLVAAGHGWTTHVRSVNPPPGTVAVPLSGLDVPMSIVLRWNRDDTSTLTSNIVEVFRCYGPGSSSASRSLMRAPARRRTPARVPAQQVPQPGKLELRFLRALVVTVEEGSVGRAAQRLSLTQSGLSRQLRALEREVGFPLLRRGANGVLATEAGEVMRVEAAAALALATDVLERAQRAGRGIEGICHIGAIASQLVGDVLSAPLKQAAARFPGIAVEVREMITPFQIPALRAREIDLGIASAIPGIVDDPAIDSVKLLDDALECAMLPASHRLASRGLLEPSDLATEPFLFIDRATYPVVYDLVFRVLAEVGLEPIVQTSVNGARAQWQLVADSMGWTIATRHMRAHPPPGTVVVPIRGFHIPSGAQLLWRRDETDPSVLAVIELFRSSRSLSNAGKTAELTT